MNAFRFVSYAFEDGEAIFRYRDDVRDYMERVEFALGDASPDAELLDRALFLAFIIIGTSYYKVSPTQKVVLEQGTIDDWQAGFFSQVYQGGLSQYAYENQLTRADLAKFKATAGTSSKPLAYSGEGILSLQSGGKDSLLVAAMLAENNVSYTPWYISSGVAHPLVLDQLASPLITSKRTIDHAALQAGADTGGLNGHVPVTYIVLALAVIQAVLLGKNTVLAAVAHEGDEPHTWIDDMPVTHQWSKSWHAEQIFAEYVSRYISADIRVGSPLRSMSELRVAELFVNYAWDNFNADFSSCNLANYTQGADNSRLTWCGNCPKCANSYLLFAPFVDRRELQQRLGGDLFAKPELFDIFKGLLGVEGHMKPFECVGEVDELRQAYHMARLAGYTKLPFDVPQSSFDKDATFDCQAWTQKLLLS